jgi:hypothetical protein
MNNFWVEYQYVFRFITEDLRKLLVLEVLLHNGGICNGYITKWCSHNSTNLLYKILISGFSMIQEESNKKNLMFFVRFLSNIF